MTADPDGIRDLRPDLGAIAARRLMGGPAHADGPILAFGGARGVLRPRAKGAFADDSPASRGTSFVVQRPAGGEGRTGLPTPADAALDDPEAACDRVRRALGGG